VTGGGRRRLLPVAALLAGGLALSASASGAAPTAEGFAAVASAQGGRVTFSVPGFAVVEDVIDGGGPVSQAAADSGGATGFASLPYPGDSAIAFPGLFNAVTGQPFPGAYPFYVAASHPTQPEQEIADPGGIYRLRAKAAEGQASGLAQLAGAAGSGAQSGSGGSVALSSVERDGDAVVARAETRNEALQLGGGALRIASVRSQSSTVYRPDGAKPVTNTELIVEGGSAGGYTFAYGPNGLVVAGQAVPIPAGQGLTQLNEALAPAGISLRIVGGEASPTGASADALEIRLAGQAPIPGMPPGILRLRFGGATSSISVGQGVGLGLGDGLGDGGFGGDLGPPPAEPDGPTAASPDPSTGGGSAGAGSTGARVSSPMSGIAGGTGAAFGSGNALGSSGTVSGIGSARTVGPSGGEPAAGSSSDAAQADAGVTAAIPIVQPRRLRADGVLYGALLLAAIALLVVAALWRGKGVVAR
jgi:hypothetical protein